MGEGAGQGVAILMEPCIVHLLNCKFCNTISAGRDRDPGLMLGVNLLLLYSNQGIRA